MNLKPMDENTLAFLKELIVMCDKYMWTDADLGLHHALYLAIKIFADENTDIVTFTEAIKNADTDQ